MLGIKQDALAYELGEDWNQKKISPGTKESVEKDILEQVAKIPEKCLPKLLKILMKIQG